VVLEDMLKARFRQRQVLAMENYGYNPMVVALIKRSFLGMFGTQLDIVLPFNHIGSIVKILESLHGSLDSLEKIHSS
jgi:hypothetical protein